MKITFLGATETVTGSKYLVEKNGKRILVDCGLFQGYKELRMRNWDRFLVDPETIDTLILTHAHIDHSGFIPLLVKQGFKGTIYCTEGTFDLCEILLPDSGHLQEEEANTVNRYGYSKHKPALPLYTKQDAIDSLKYFKVVEYGKTVSLGENFHFTYSRAGHIIGSAFIMMSYEKKTILFTGDLGRPSDPVMKPPVEIQYADYLLIESTYGNRLHSKRDPVQEMGEIINRTIDRGGSVLIPSFAVGRTQSVLYYLWELFEKNAIPKLPVFIDSPMAIDATKILCKYSKEHKVAETLCPNIGAIAQYVHDVEESKRLDHLNNSAIIISASGMMTGGRVLHHLKNLVVDEKNTILMTGYQAEGTRGDRLVKGEKEIKVLGQIYPVRAEIVNLSNASAHADYSEILQWLRHFRRPPIQTFVVHGEVEAAVALKEKIVKEFGWDVVVPKYQHVEEI